MSTSVGAYPELAANEFFCLEVARRAGLRVPSYQLSDDGGALVIERFDRSDDTYRGFEDFCVLNGVQSRDKYRGSYETGIWKRLREFVSVSERDRATAELFTLFVVNCAVRNGDAHLKNFGVLYDSPNGDVMLAPVYDVVTTTAYLPQDKMALTLDGSTDWPDRKRLMRLGQTRANLNAKHIAQIFESVNDAIADTLKPLRVYFAEHDRSLGERIANEWLTGVRSSTQVR